MGRYDELNDELTLAAPADERDLHWLRRDVGDRLPEDYLTFLAAHDGGVGAVGRLSPASEVGRGSDVCPELDHLSDLVVIGSNGGGEAFAFDADGRVMVVPWIG